MITCLTMTVIGGRTSVAGGILAAVILIHLPEWFRVLQDYRLLAFGAVALFMVVVAPEGLVGALAALRQGFSLNRRPGCRSQNCTKCAAATMCPATRSFLRSRE